MTGIQHDVEGLGCVAGFGVYTVNDFDGRD